MKRLKEKINPHYLKICVCAVISCVIAFAICLILLHSQSFFSGAWNLIKALATPLLHGAIICYLLMPITNALIRLLNGKSREVKPWTRPAAVALTFFIILAVLAGLILLLIFFISRGIRLIRLDDITQFIVSVRDELSDFSAAIREMIAGLDLPIADLGKILTNLIGSASGSISDFLADIPRVAAVILFAIIFSVYFLLDGKRIGGYLKRAISILFKEETVNKTRQLLKDADEVFSGYLRGKILDALILGVILTIAYLIAGVPYALVTGIFTGIVFLIPSLGSILSYLILLLAYLVQGDFSGVWLGLILLTVIQTIDTYVFYPKLLNRSITIHPLLVIVALIAGGAVGGLLGILIAVPVIAFLKLQFDRYLARREQAKKPQETKEA